MTSRFTGLAGRARWSFLCVAVLLWGLLAQPATPIRSASLDTIADYVLGQPNFTSNTPNSGASGLYWPWAMAIDRNSGRLYVADAQNNRVLSWPNVAMLASSQAADIVIGQPDFTSNQINQGGAPGAASLNRPLGVAVGSSGNLYIADTFNNRVLAYTTPLTTGMAADWVFGQPDFTNSVANNGGISRSTLNLPQSIAIDAHGNLYVADTNNHRVLEYTAPLIGDAAADRVFGQPNFVSDMGNNGGIGAGSLGGSEGVIIDDSNNLYVADTTNNRMLRYDLPVVDVLPTITEMAPCSAIVAGPAFTLTITGTNFIDGMVVSWNGAAQPTTVVSATLLTAQIGAGGIAAAGAVSVTIALPDGSGSNTTSFAVNNPLPAITSLSRAEAVAGEAGFTLTITGTNFISTSMMRWNGADRPTTFVSSTRLTAQISAADIAIAGPAIVTVFNSTPGGGLSNASAFTIKKPSYVVYMPLVAR